LGGDDNGAAGSNRLGRETKAGFVKPNKVVSSRKGSLQRPIGLDKPARRLSIKERAARDNGNVPPHEQRELKPPVFRVHRKPENTVE
jgi:hypothetical protein